MTMRRTIESFPLGLPDAYLGNGIIGYRVKPNPFESWKAVASGFVKDHDEWRFESLAYAPYPFVLSFRLNDSAKAGPASVLRQSLDMSCGELTTEMELPLGKGIGRARVTQFVSRTCPVVACQETRLTVPEAGELEVTAPVVLGPGSEIVAGMPPGHSHMVDVMVCFAPGCGRSKCGVATKLDFGEFEVERQRIEPADIEVSRTFRLNVQAGQEIVIRTLAATVTSIYHAEPDLEACRLVNWADAIGFDELRARNRAAWDEIWKSRVIVTGDDRAQEYLDCCLFYLFSSAHQSCRTSIPPFGVSQAANYYGHVFWDTDIYMTPTLALVSPETARMTVDYRLRCLDAAIRRARAFGYAGAMYPWESDTRGFEATPSNCATGWMEQHINMCVAITAWWFQQGCGNAEYARETVWPILKSVAEWIVTRVTPTERGFELRDIMSADEAHQVNNSSYVNALCAQALRFACDCARLLGIDPPKQWPIVANGMFVPVGPAPGVDGDIVYLHEKGWHEEAFVDSFMIGFPFDLPFDRDLLKRTYEFFLKFPQETLSMGNCFFAGDAAFVGDRAGARRLFDQVIADTWETAWGMGTEYTHADTTCFVTTMGGMLQTAMMAFTGLRFEPGNWAKYDACLPEGWEKIEIERIYLGGNAYRLIAENGSKAALTKL